MKKEIKESKPKNPFLYIIQMSKKHKRVNSNIISNNDKSKFIRTNTPIKFVKKQKNNNRLNISTNQMFPRLDSKNLYKNISNQSPLFNSFTKVRYKSQNKQQSYESIKLQINKLKNQLNKQNKEIEKSQNKINILLNENLNKENLLYNYFVEMNEQIMHSLNEDMPNIDNMTYEELLALEDKIGYVNKGFSKNQIDKIKSYKYDGENISCVICQENIEKNNDIKQLSCLHIFHSKCIDPWLTKEKNCPFCKEEHKFSTE